MQRTMQGERGISARRSAEGRTPQPYPAFAGAKRLFGLVGSGRTELLETLFGARRMRSGTVTMAGRQLNLRQPGAAVAAGIALVPSDRFRNSVLLTMRATDNVLLPSLRRDRARRSV